MTQFKTIILTAAAVLALPSVALAQVPVDAATDAVKEKAVDKVMGNMTTDDAVVAGTTMLKGGSKEDAAIAVVKNRAEKKIDAITGDMSVGDVTRTDVSMGGVIDTGKTMAEDKMMGTAKGSATTYTGGSKSSATTYTDGVSAGDVSAAGGLDAGKAMALEQARAKAKAMSMEKAKTYGETYGMSDNEKAKRMISSGAPYVIQKSGAPMTAPAETASMTAPAVSTLNCPSGTKDAGDGTCMITGDWKP